MSNRIVLIIFLVLTGIFTSCSGSKKYFKAAEKLEQQGLVGEAAEYYLMSLEKKSSNIDARIKLKEVGQKHINNLSSSFFRQFSTQQLEQSITTFDEIKAYTNRASVLNVTLNYPQAYQDDYNKAIDVYLNKYYNESEELVNQGRFDLALKSIQKVKKYGSSFKKIKELEITSRCEPLYQAVIRDIESKNYRNAKNSLASISYNTPEYKDSKELIQLVDDMLKKSFIIFAPKNTPEKDIEEKLYNNFIELSYKKTNAAKILNNTPFLYMPQASDISSAGNLDLIQAIRKATGADYFYVFDITNKKETEAQPTKANAVCFEKIVTKKDTVYITEYRPINYYQVKAQRSYAYDFKYKIIDAASNQMIVSKNESCTLQDNVDYYEFPKNITINNINNFFPYNPYNTPPQNQYNPNNWRAGFNNRKELKSMADLKNEVDSKALNIFSNTLDYYISK